MKYLHEASRVQFKWIGNGESLSVIYYIAYGCDIVRDKISCDNYTNQITTGIVVNSTKETEPIYLNGEYYPYYPKIREEDINTNTSNIFVDTMQISNIYLAGMGADFDGVKHIA